MTSYDLAKPKSREKLHVFADEPYTVPLEGNLTLRVYTDSRPHNLEVAQLQKGVVLTLNDKELIEEGVGLGVPVAIFTDKAYFSGSAHVTTAKKGKTETVVKHFVMDMVSRKIWKRRFLVDNPLYELFSNSLAGAYRDYPGSRRLVFPLIKFRNKIGIRTIFMKVEPKGEVKITYKIKHDSVEIEADFTKLNTRHCEKVLLLNEQGSTFFTRFFDSNGLSLNNDKIGAWDLIEADWACFSDLDDTVSFCLTRVPNSRIFRGREYIRGRLAWAGMGFELSPCLDFFKYTIQIGRRKRNA